MKTTSSYTDKLIRSTRLTPAVAIFALCLTTPFALHAQTPTDMQQSGTQQAQAPIRGEHEAMKMVPARAALKGDLDAARMQPGSSFHAILAGKVRLSDGQELPAGTLLLGTVAEDDMQFQGNHKLALRFNTAELKGGQSIPIKATIVGAESPETMNDGGYTVNPGDQEPNNWNDRTLKVDQIGAFSGVDLHASIASKNSGVFISTKSKDIKLKTGSELALAIAPAQAAAPTQGDE